MGAMSATDSLDSLPCGNRPSYKRTLTQLSSCACNAKSQLGYSPTVLFPPMQQKYDLRFHFAGDAIGWQANLDKGYRVPVSRGADSLRELDWKKMSHYLPPCMDRTELNAIPGEPHKGRDDADLARRTNRLALPTKVTPTRNSGRGTVTLDPPDGGSDLRLTGRDSRPQRVRPISRSPGVNSVLQTAKLHVFQG